MAQQSIMALHDTEQFQVPDLPDAHQNCVYYRSDTYENWASRIVKDGLALSEVRGQYTELTRSKGVA